MAGGEHRLGTGVAPGAPPTGYVSLYAKGDKKLYFKDDAGLETGPLGAGGATLVGPSKAIFVDPVTGNDGTGTRGDASKPFLTVGAAVGAAGIAAGDVILLLPGTHTVTTTIPEPAVANIAIVGCGRDVTRVQMNSGGGLLPFVSIGATVVDGFRMADLTVATFTGDIPLSADGGTNGLFMQKGLVLENVYFTTLTSAPTVGPQLRFCSRLDINNVLIDGSLLLDTCAMQPTVTVQPSRITNLTVKTSTTIRWDDDLAQAAVPPMTRDPLYIRDSDLGSVLLDKQPNVHPRNCRYNNLSSLNPLGDSLTGVAAIWDDLGCVLTGLGNMDFTGAQRFLDSVVGPSFSFRHFLQEGSGVCAFERVAEVNGRTIVAFTALDGPGNFGVLQARLGVDLRVFGTTYAPGLSVVSTGTITPGSRTFFFLGPLAAGNNVIPFPWGPAFAAPLFVHITPVGVYDDLVVAGYKATGVTINAATGGGSVMITPRWSA